MKIQHLLKNSLLSLALFGGITAKAQQPAAQQSMPCNTYKAMEDHFAQDPAARIRWEQAEAAIIKASADNLNKTANKAAAAPVYTIPVVFHILHTGGSENIPDANCVTALNFVNLDYARANTDANQTDALFNSSYISSDIVFKLAHKDPNGNCTTGINHYYDTRTDWSDGANATNFGHTWDPTKYLNIYIVKQIVPTNTVAGGGTIIGYTFKPGTWPTGASQDAIVYRFDNLTSGTDARSLSHEIGHWLSLSHTWGDTNAPNVACGDDNVGDTPETKGNLYNCPSSSVNVCAQTNTVYNNQCNVQNIMNYSSCKINFTTGQTNKMRSALQSTVNNRINVCSAANLIATDVNGTGPCAPIADFISIAPGDYTVCAGQTLNTMKDFSYNGTITTWAWGATNNATITAPSASITSMYFPTPGPSVVSLTVSNSTGSSVKTRTVTVVDGAVTATNGIAEGFEGSGTPAGWSVWNYSGVSWAQTNLASLEGSKSFLLDGTISSSGQEDILYMPVMDFASNPNLTLHFYYAYRLKQAGFTDVFKVQLSADCGGSWKDVFAPSPASMSSGSGGTGTTPFTPTSTTQWKFADASSHPNYFQFTASSSVMGRFYFQEGSGGFGNRLFIDSINLVAAPVGLNELTKHISLKLSPNPTNSSANVSFVLSNSANVKLSVMDITGKIVSAQRSYDLAQGEHTIVVNENGTLNKGIYIVSIEYNGTKMARKLIIE